VHGRETEEAALVSMGAPHLRLLGLEVPDTLPDGKAVLWSLLERRVGQDAAHPSFNALQRRLVSFERALACVSRLEHVLEQSAEACGAAPTDLVTICY
jgi:hypothetical protein